MIHNKECLADQKRWEEEIKKFEEDHPYYCRSCRGWGGRWYTFDPSPRGISLSHGSMVDFDACPHCTDFYLCPHCKSHTVEVGPRYNRRFICLKCGWNEFQPSGMPEKPECECWILMQNCKQAGGERNTRQE